MIVLVLAIAVPAGMATHGRTGAAPGKLAFNSALGSSLPNQRGVVVVGVRCTGAARSVCRGRIRLLPRGQTRGLLGAMPLASRTFSMKTGGDGDVRLTLRSAAKEALARGRTLAVSAELRGSGKTKTHRGTIAQARGATGSAKPANVRVDHPPRGGGGTTTMATYTWSWDIPAGHYLILPKFSCPDSAPRVARGDQFTQSGFTAFTARISVTASKGVGYGGFDHATVGNDFSGAHFTWVTMAGWPEGGFWFNSVWASPTEAGTFGLSVTCTDVENSDAAFVRQGYEKTFFPWKD